MTDDDKLKCSFLDEQFLSKKGELNTTESWKCYKKKKGGGREQVPVTKVGSQSHRQSIWRNSHNVYLKLLFWCHDWHTYRFWWRLMTGAMPSAANHANLNMKAVRVRVCARVPSLIAHLFTCWIHPLIIISESA